MTSVIALLAGSAVLLAALLYSRRVPRQRHDRRSYELGAVSTRWLSELRRDEPWTR